MRRHRIAVLLGGILASVLVASLLSMGLSFEKEMATLERLSRGHQPDELRGRVLGWFGHDDYHHALVEKKLKRFLARTTPDMLSPEELLRFIKMATRQGVFERDLAHAVARWSFAGFDAQPVPYSPVGVKIAEALLNYHWEQLVDRSYGVEADRHRLQLTRVLLAQSRAPYVRTSDLTAFVTCAMEVALAEDDPDLVREAVAAAEEAHQLYRHGEMPDHINRPLLICEAHQRVASTMLQAFETDPEQWKEFRDPIERILTSTSQELETLGTNWGREWSGRLRTRFEAACARR